MLTADLVRARIREGRVEVRSVDAAARERIIDTVRAYVTILSESIGRAHRDIDEAIDALTIEARDARLLAGVRKLLLDRCDFTIAEGVAPQIVRRAVFTHATTLRQASSSDQPFERSAALTSAAEELGLSVETVEARLYADLKSAQRLVSFEPIAADALLDSYDLAQEQAVLLRATEVRLRVCFREAGAARTFFRKLKFRRLLFRIHEEDDGWYGVRIDGPFNLFQASTKYGLQLALLLPTIREVGVFRLEADVRWGPERQAVTFSLEGDGPQVGGGKTRLPDDVQLLVKRFRALDSEWKVRPSRRLLSVPGYGICVPDLVFSRGGGGPRVYLEILGFWSRQAVWRRIDLVQAGLREPVIFAVSSRLRVSEAALDEDAPSALYVYKGTMNAKAIAERLEAYAAH